jgi:hypothetical protein
MSVATNVGAGSWVQVQYASPYYGWGWPHYWGCGPYWHWGPFWHGYWRASQVFAGAGPDVAVVDADIRPERARLYLDGSFIGIADDFDGYPDYLFLKPGKYVLEAQLGGFSTESIEIEAKADQWYSLNFKLQRRPGERKEKRSETPVRPKPVTRIFEPKVAPEPAPAKHRAGPDLSLRPDIAGRVDVKREPVVEQAATLQLRVSPGNASVYVDGAFLATGMGLSRMGRPVTLTAGQHTLEVLAPGHAPVKKTIMATPGKTLELVIELAPVATITPTRNQPVATS